MRIHLLVAISVISLLCIVFFIFFPTRTTVNQTELVGTGKQKLYIKDKFLLEWDRMIRKYLNFPLDTHYGSHAIVLLAASYVTKSGPILELGMGPTSSPLLHRLALEQNRFLLSADSDRRWINHFQSFTLNNTFHELKHVDVKTEMGIEWATSNLADYKNWTIVFIDHRPGPRRQYDLMSYSHRSDIVILHDTEQSSLYQYNSGLSLYRYKYRFTKLKTYTDSLSSKNETLIVQVRQLLDSTPVYYFSNITLNQIL